MLPSTTDLTYFLAVAANPKPPAGCGAATHISAYPQHRSSAD